MKALNICWLIVSVTDEHQNQQQSDTSKSKSKAVGQECPTHTNQTPQSEPLWRIDDPDGAAFGVGFIAERVAAVVGADGAADGQFPAAADSGQALPGHPNVS